MERNPVHGIVADGTAELHGSTDALGLQEGVNVDGYIGLGQVFAMQATTGHGVSHIAAELPVGRAGVHIRAAGPIAERIDLHAGIGFGQLLCGSVALAENQADAVQDVFPVRCVFLIYPAGNGRELFLFWRQRHTFENAVVSTAQALRLVRG